MKANPARRAPVISTLVLLCGACALSACDEAAAPVISAPPPAPAPTVAPVAPPPPPAPTVPWTQAPISAGAWSVGSGAVPPQAAYRGAEGAFALRCDPARGGVVLERSAAAGGPAPFIPQIEISTATQKRTLNAAPLATGGAIGVQAVLPVGDRLLDAMAFTRARLMVAVPGMTPLYLPADPAVGRVVERCRAGG
ncbi:hypothetical protein GTZ99_01025 [Novosphingobium sp. FSY-8]|uniref:Uncharacterized protein n=1 Tax=Novosphingobium ovatum TaxID=1908523 RepID=A0ABW9X9C5_9SPHN|nr:hypothetical protein [Novosphingobium ovatum]NBC35136.1 hypothetical protein [Novosphingobium ovatum]